MAHVTDGDTFELHNGVGVRMIGINAPDRGEKLFTEATQFLTLEIQGRRCISNMIDIRTINTEEFSHGYGRGVKKVPAFLPSDYMHLTYNSSREGLTENPEGCKRDARK